MTPSGTESAPAPLRTGTLLRRAHVLYLPVLGTAMGLMMLRILLMARLLDVSGFAQYSAGLLISTTFCMLGCIGLYLVLQRDMPIMMARGRQRRALIAMARAVLVAVICATVALAGSALHFVPSGLSPALLALGVVHGLSQQVFLVTTVESRSKGEPLRYSLQNFWRALLIVAGSGAVAATTGSAGWALATEATISLVLTAAILLRIGKREGLPLPLLLRAASRNWQQVRWKTALVFLALSFAASTVFYLDRWLSAAFLSKHDFAQYAFAGVAVLVAQSMQSMVNASVYPLLARRFALSGQAVAYELSARVSLGILGVALLAAIPVTLLAVMAVARWYPQYELAVPVLWLLVGVGVLRISDFWSSFLVICGYERRLLVLHLAVAIAVCILWGAAMAARSPHDARPADFAWLALLLALGSHAGAALAATVAYRTLQRGLTSRVSS